MHLETFDPMNPSVIDCRVCGASCSHIFNGALLNHNVRYYECATCKYVQTEAPHWLDEAYSEVINRSDTGILRRNERNARLVIRTLALIGRIRGTVIDCAGGYGFLVRMLRDRGVDARWADRYCENLVARGFEAEEGERADLITAFEALEHFVEPITELSALLSRANHVLVSTDLIPIPSPQPGTWWYYGPEHGQHIGFYRLSTLEWMAHKLNCHVVSDGKSFHLFSRHPVTHWRWILARRTARWAALWSRLHLKSRMWTDHRLMTATDARKRSDSKD